MRAKSRHSSAYVDRNFAGRCLRKYHSECITCATALIHQRKAAGLGNSDCWRCGREWLGCQPVVVIIAGGTVCAGSLPRRNLPIRMGNLPRSWQPRDHTFRHAPDGLRSRAGEHARLHHRQSTCQQQREDCNACRHGRKPWQCPPGELSCQ